MGWVDKLVDRILAELDIEILIDRLVQELSRKIMDSLRSDSEDDS